MAFLDRDGTICVEKNYLSSPDDLELIQGVSLSIRELNHMGIKVVILSNQSGIARGYFSIEQLITINNRLKELLAAEGATLDGIYFCPHHPKGSVKKYSLECNCRKPKPGMMLQACHDFSIPVQDCIVIGDKLSDTRMGMNEHLVSILVRTGYGRQEESKGKMGIDYTVAVDDFAHAIDYIKQGTKNGK